MVSTQVAAVALVFALHVAGGMVLIWGMFEGERPDLFGGWWPRDVDDDPGPVPPSADSGPGGLPLPDAEPGPRRRDHADAPARSRVRRGDPAHAPRRAPIRAPRDRGAP